MSFLSKNALALVPVIAAFLPVASHSQTRDVKIYGFGAKSGVVRIFGLNSEAAMKAAAEMAAAISSATNTAGMRRS